MSKLCLGTGILMSGLLLLGCSSQMKQQEMGANSNIFNGTLNAVVSTLSAATISEAEAKEIAFSHAGVSESDVSFLKVKLDFDDGIWEYEVEFYVGNTEYEYEIHATTGVIRSFDVEGGRPSTGVTTTPSTSFITEAEAKEIALSHAGFRESDVTFVKVKFDYDDGIPEYEVEFYVGNMEYDYEIHGVTGEIRSYDHEMESSRPNTDITTTPSTSLITGAEAKEIALSHAGFRESDVTFVKVKFDYDDGIPEYEVEFYVGNMEYDYEIHGVTGEIRGYDHEMETARPSTSIVGIDDWALPFVQFVSPQIMPDISATNYDTVSTRGLIAQSIYNMQGNGEIVASNHALTDVGSYGTAINWCYENGIMNGMSATTFGTENLVKREEFALILRQLANNQGKNVGSNQSSLSSYGDCDSISVWAVEGMDWAVENNLMSGSNNLLKPGDSIKRVEVAVMLSAFTNL